MKTHTYGFLTILALITVSGAALAFMGTSESQNQPDLSETGDSELVTVTAALTQDKVLLGSDGTVSVALTLSAQEMEQMREDVEPLDLVVVLDRSGSMKGRKINDAKRAVINLLGRMSPRDRMSIITYSNGVEILSGLLPMNQDSREYLSSIVNRIYSGGGTNLGGGLKSGIDMLMGTKTTGRQRKIILISDGLANHGTTSPSALGAMAGNAAEFNLTVSTVGVGYDFNEVLMTTIADHGSGNYYFLENPQAFADVFEKEFNTARNVAAAGIEIRVPLDDGLQLKSAGGFPFKVRNNVALVRPGVLMAGQQRRIFLSYRIPTGAETSVSLGSIQVRYRHEEQQQVVSTPGTLTVDCVDDQKDVIASIDEGVWSEHVVKEDYNRLKDEVATAIRSGKKEAALQAIEEYEQKNDSINSIVDSDEVSQNLDKDVKALRKSVQTTFAGAPAAVAAKKKQQAKILQYESYQERRAKK